MQVYNISDTIIPGMDNLIIVEVNNGDYCVGNWVTDQDVSGGWISDSHMATDETTTNWNGIIGKIQLVAQELVHIKSVRVYPNVTDTPEAAFEAADELGLYLQPELYLFGCPVKDPFSTYNTYAYMKEEGEGIIKAYANHPSFIILSFGNETAATDLRKLDLYHYFKKLDSSRLYSEGSNTFYWDNEIGDRNIGDYRAASSTNLGHCRELYYFEDHAPSTTLNSVFGNSVTLEFP